ncbi:MAG: hypothetical protein M0001_05315 [Treponema sp.]|nr:hypothetical protein [Treponema sp.]
MKKADVLWVVALAAVVAAFAYPDSGKVLLALTASHPYLMGFAKFALLASMGELLVLRLAKGAWVAPRGLPLRAIVWGLVGILIVLMFTLFSGGVATAASKGLLPIGSGGLATFLQAFWTSALMNLTFGPAFMAAHRVSDAWIDARFAVRGSAGVEKNGRKGPRLGEVVASVDWNRFLTFVVGKTIPLFWIPAHTITFLLPGEYRVLVAALLSIALGVILTWGKRTKAD